MQKNRNSDRERWIEREREVERKKDGGGGAVDGESYGSEWVFACSSTGWTDVLLMCRRCGRPAGDAVRAERGSSELGAHSKICKRICSSRNVCPNLPAMAWRLSTKALIGTS